MGTGWVYRVGNTGVYREYYPATALSHPAERAPEAPVGAGVGGVATPSRPEGYLKYKTFQDP